jgi:hypothetical protein
LLSHLVDLINKSLFQNGTLLDELHLLLSLDGLLESLFVYLELHLHLLHFHLQTLDLVLGSPEFSLSLELIHLCLLK